MITKLDAGKLLNEGHVIIGEVELSLYYDSRERALLIAVKVNEIIHEIKTRSFRELIATDTE